MIKQQYNYICRWLGSESFFSITVGGHVQQGDNDILKSEGDMYTLNVDLKAGKICKQGFKGVIAAVDDSVFSKMDDNWRTEFT